MMVSAEQELICDFAETYHICDFRALPCSYAATLAMGLGRNSRTKKKITGQKTDDELYLLAAIADRLSLLVWAKTKDAQKGRNKPKMFTDALMGREEKKNEKPLAFNTPEELDRALAKFERQ